MNHKRQKKTKDGEDAETIVHWPYNVNSLSSSISESPRVVQYRHFVEILDKLLPFAYNEMAKNL